MPKTIGVDAHAAGYVGPQDPARLRVDLVRRESVEEFRERMAAKAAARVGFRLRLVDANRAPAAAVRAGEAVLESAAQRRARRNRLIVEDYTTDESVTTRELGERYGLTPPKVLDVLHAAGVQVRHRLAVPKSPRVRAPRPSAAPRPARPARARQPRQPCEPRAPRGPRTSPQAARNAAMVAAYATDPPATIRDLATEHGVSTKRVRQILERAGVQVRPTVRPRPAREALAAQRAQRAARDEQDRATAVAGYQAGRSAQDLAVELHRSNTTVRGWIRDAGLELRHGPRESPDRVAALAAAYRAGASLGDLAAEHAMTRKHLSRVLSAAGVPMRRNPASEETRRDGLVPQVVAAYTAGERVPDLAARFGVAQPTIRGWLRHAGVSLRDDRLHHPPTADLPQILAAYAAGRTLPELAAAFHHQKATIRGWLLDAGVSLRDDRKTRSGSKPKTAAADDPALAALVVQAYAQGATLEAIAAQVPGVGSVKHATGILRRAGVPLRRARSVSIATPAMLERAVAMRAEGASQQKIADELGISQNTVSRYLRGVSRAKPPTTAPSPPPPVPVAEPSPVLDLGDVNARLVAASTALREALERLTQVEDLTAQTLRLVHRAYAQTSLLLAALPIPTPEGEHP